MSTVFRRANFELVWNDDANAGYLYVAEIHDGQVITSHLLADNVIADYDTDGKLLGIEFLGPRP